jgi:hypothetical protein
VGEEAEDEGEVSEEEGGSEPAVDFAAAAAAVDVRTLLLSAASIVCQGAVLITALLRSDHPYY